jgi:hypothetical protein
MTSEPGGFGARDYRSFGIYEDRDEYDGRVQYGGKLTHAPLGRREVHMPVTLDDHLLGRVDMSAAALPVVSHHLPDAAHSLLEAVRAVVAFLVAEFCQR